MQYTSTRDASVRVDSVFAIARGIAPDGGLYVPAEIPRLDNADFTALRPMDYRARAAYIIGKFLTDFSAEELNNCINKSYSDKFEGDAIAPVAHLKDGKNLLELWHGPTCAFKDMALQLLPQLLICALKKCDDDREIVILVATSGDTGKAALDGFADVPGTRIIVFYPEEGVSNIQKLQMVTQEGKNVAVCAVSGNFDDAQNGVKKIFTDMELNEKLNDNGFSFSSANSINWGRLVPQIVYYISAYLDLNLDDERNQLVNITVPTGNFGNILAAYYAKKMGLPVGRLICASNSNNVLTDFINTGVYDCNRPFFTTISPSMDILISSNLERLLWMLSGDSARVKGWMTDLIETGRYEVDDDIKLKLKNSFWASYCDDEMTKNEIREIFENEKYLCDTHTAVACHVYKQYRNKTQDLTPSIIAATASPFKFSGDVLSALGVGVSGLSEFEIIQKLSDVSGLSIPAPLSDLKDKPTRFTQVCGKEAMRQAVLNILGIK